MCLEFGLLAVAGLPIIVWAFQQYIVPGPSGVNTLLRQVLNLVAVVTIIAWGSITWGLVTSLFGFFVCLVCGFSHFVVPPDWEPSAFWPAMGPMSLSLLAVLVFLSSFCSYHRDRCTLSLYGFVCAFFMGIGFELPNKTTRFPLIFNAVMGFLGLYGLFLYVRRHRKLPPGLHGCKFLTLDALRGMLDRGEKIRRCQDLPHNVFGDPERARFLVVLSHRWINPRTCDVPTAQHPGGLRLETMVNKLERFFSPSSLGKGSTLAERLRFATYSLASHKDVVVFFDFMCVPQAGIAPDGTVIPRTAEEEKIFLQCLANMSVLYSTFQVLVCDEVPDGVALYSDSGWCFSELVTAELGGQLACFSPDYVRASRASQTTWHTALHTAFATDGAFDFDNMLGILNTALNRKQFRDESDRAVVRSLFRGFLIKHMIVRAIRRRDISLLALALSLVEPNAVGTIGDVLDQPVDDVLNTPLHSAVAHGFRDGARMLVQKGARCNVANLRGDTPLQFLGWVPEGSLAGFFVRRHLASELVAI